MAIVVLVVGVPVGLILLGRGGDGSPPGPRTAAIVDQLSLTDPNPDFVASATSLLQQAGYQVDYYPGEQVTVDFYRRLPEGNHDLLVMRSHSTALVFEGEQLEDVASWEEEATSVAIFTNEPYRQDLYYDEQLAGRIGFGQYAQEYSENAPKWFGITPEFIRSSMEGRFDGTTVIMMGCQGLLNEKAAEAFAEKGADIFISFDGLISGEYSDTATERLLEKLLIEGLPVGDAVAQTAAEVGPDPVFGANLRILTGDG